MRWILTTALAASLTLTVSGCALTKRDTYLSAQEALVQVQDRAVSWAQDATLEKVEDLKVAGETQLEDGKAAAWRFVFRSKDKAQQFVVELVGEDILKEDITELVDAGSDLLTTFGIPTLAVDSDQAVAIAAGIGRGLLAELPEATTTALKLVFNENFQRTVWEVQYGAREAVNQLTILVDALNGEVLGSAQ